MKFVSFNHLHELLFHAPGYWLCKNQQLIYTFGNEDFLKLLDMRDVSGKTDYQLPWANTHADRYRADDKKVLQGTAKINYVETQTVAINSLYNVSVNKIPLVDANERVQGIICNYQIIKKPSPNMIKLSKQQQICLNLIKQGLTAKQIARKLKLSIRTVEGYTEIIKEKYNCLTKAELIIKALQVITV